jgi:hypothetical protein
VEKQFRGPLEGTFMHRKAVSHMIKTVDVTHVPVVPFHDVRFHGVVGVVKKNFLLLVVGPCQPACKLFVCP